MRVVVSDFPRVQEPQLLSYVLQPLKPAHPEAVLPEKPRTSQSSLADNSQLEEAAAQANQQRPSAASN